MTGNRVAEEKVDSKTSSPKVDMGETFLGTNMGDVAENHFFYIPLRSVFIFTLGELFFFFVVWMFVSA